MQTLELCSELQQLGNRYWSRLESDLTAELETLGRQDGIADDLKALREGHIDIDALAEYSSLSRDLLQFEEDIRIITAAERTLQNQLLDIERSNRYGVPVCQIGTAMQHSADFESLVTALQEIADCQQAIAAQLQPSTPNS